MCAGFLLKGIMKNLKVSKLYRNCSNKLELIKIIFKCIEYYIVCMHVKN